MFVNWNLICEFIELQRSWGLMSLPGRYKGSIASNLLTSRFIEKKLTQFIAQKQLTPHPSYHWRSLRNDKNTSTSRRDANHALTITPIIPILKPPTARQRSWTRTLSPKRKKHYTDPILLLRLCDTNWKSYRENRIHPRISHKDQG